MSAVGKLAAWGLIVASLVLAVRPDAARSLSRVDWTRPIDLSDWWDTDAEDEDEDSDVEEPEFTPVKGPIYKAWRAEKHKQDAIEQAMLWRQAAAIVESNKPTLGEVVKLVEAAGEIASVDRQRSLNEANPKGASAIADAFAQFDSAANYTPEKWAEVATNVADQLLTAGLE